MNRQQYTSVKTNSVQTFSVMSNTKTFTIKSTMTEEKIGANISSGFNYICRVLLVISILKLHELI